MMGPKATPALTHLVEILKGEGLAGPEAALAALSELGPKARAAVPALLRALAHDEPSIRSGAAEALAAIGDRAVLPELERFLEDKDLFVRENARASLEKLRDPQR